MTEASQQKSTSSSSWLQALAVYRDRSVLTMLFLGFSSGLPFYLIFQTLSAWLRQEGIQRSTIGMMAWVGLMYSIKVLWSPLVDRVQLPFLFTRLGRRRSWMLLAQIGISIALFNLSSSQPSLGVAHIAWGALFLAFCAATQDIAVDAWRIESGTVGMQGAMTAAYTIGYRGALIVGGAGALGLAGRYSWTTSYLAMAAVAGVGIVTTLLTKEPDQPAETKESKADPRVERWLEERAHWPHFLRTLGARFHVAVVAPLLEFFSRFSFVIALITVLFMCSYRLTDFTMGAMANPFYIDQGYTLEQIGTIVKAVGLPVGMVGAVLGGIMIAKWGVRPVLIIGSLMVMTSNLGFALLAKLGTPTLLGLGIVNSIDNLALGVHGTVLITFLSSLTNPRYTATQYALFTSFYALPGKILEGFSGFIAERLGYAGFFVYTASLSVPALLLLLWLARTHAIAALNDAPATASTK